MRQYAPSLSSALTVFVLFFGIALLDAFKLGHWWSALFWVAIGGTFVVLGLRGRRRVP